MSSKTTYWCDRCGIELGLDDLLMFTAESERMSEHQPHRVHYELCEPCCTELERAVEGAMMKAGVA